MKIKEMLQHIQRSIRVELTYEGKVVERGDAMQLEENASPEILNSAVGLLCSAKEGEVRISIQKRRKKS